MRCKIFSLIVILLLAANFCDGQVVESVTKTENKEKTVPEKPMEQQQPVSQQEEKQKKIWPQPFQPSEQVSADAVISFPTDI